MDVERHVMEDTLPQSLPRGRKSAPFFIATATGSTAVTTLAYQPSRAEREASPEACGTALLLARWRATTLRALVGQSVSFWSNPAGRSSFGATNGAAGEAGAPGNQNTYASDDTEYPVETLRAQDRGLERQRQRPTPSAQTRSAEAY